MKPKVYSSYDEIDRDLEILKLQKEIDVRKLALTMEKTMEGITPIGMVKNFLGNTGEIISKSGLLKNILLPLLIRKFTKFME
ncbi:MULTISPECIES: DUF6327 family protein [Flavobacterium]|uniref:DUF6327 family protein n=1 Tax=Flavobacterium TaxID=237 RepID=UPI001FCAAD2A|nr:MULTISPECIES: DUF6327 family protein [Flavobacterium]UOK43133.1 DUF6327 family protein [Flavobacterium enshiense]